MRSSSPCPTASPPASSRTGHADGATVIDLGPDFRLRDRRRLPALVRLRASAAGPPRAAPSTGCRSSIAPSSPRSATAERTSRRSSGAPGCYPTATILALAPLARAGLIGDLVVDAKSGVSGAGREPKPDLMFGEVNESVKAYGVGGHRHVAEIEQELGLLGRLPRARTRASAASTSCPTSSR